jgi:hypothetical protein
MEQQQAIQLARWGVGFIRRVHRQSIVNRLHDEGRNQDHQLGLLAIAALARSGLIALFLLAPRADILPRSFKPALAFEAPSPRCSVSHLDALLAPYAGRVVLALPDDTPELLYRTRILTVGSFYHRNPAAVLCARPGGACRLHRNPMR